MSYFVDRSGVRLYDGHDLKLFILVGWDRSSRSSSIAWSTGAQLRVFFCFRFPVVLFDRSVMQLVVSVES